MSEQRNERLLASIRGRVASSGAFRQIAEAGEEKRVALTGLSLEARALLLATLQEKLGRKIAIVVPGDANLADLNAALALFHRDHHCVGTYPNPSLSPYQEVPPSLAVIRDEIRALTHILDGTLDLLLIPARALMRRLPPPSEFRQRGIELRTGEDIAVRETLEKLVDGGFVRTDLVGEIGEFAFRGGIIDLFPPDLDQPVRLELFGDTIDSIRFFDVETQRSAESTDAVFVHPLSHFPVNKEIRSALARAMSRDFNDPIYRRDLADKIDRLNEQASIPGLEHLVPLVSEHATFFDYLSAERGWQFCLFEPDQITATLEKYDELLRNEYELASEKGLAVYAPDRLLVSAEQIAGRTAGAQLAFADLVVASRERKEIRLAAPQMRSFVNALSELPDALHQGHNAARAQVIFVSTKGGREKVERLLKEFAVPHAENGDAIGPELVVSHGLLPHGFDFPAAGLQFLSEWDLFEPPSNTRVARRRTTEAFVTDLRDLKPNDLIVHVDHGVGRFVGLRRIPFGETDREVMEIEYSSGGKLLLPMESLNLIQKYSSGADVAPKLDKLGGTAWARTKASVKKAMRDMADELLKLYATRQMVSGHSFSTDSPWQMDFEESFEFDETEDQLNAIDDVKHDMESRRPMDRLLCGDVGYGKTEVAMRAAFKAVLDGKQVAVLAPTTILAYQHYRTFLRRFASFPVAIELISRFRSPKEQKVISEKLRTGEIDVVVGTHRLLSKDVQFNDLGLLVIDEEQRFGVGQKEKLKQLKKAVDVLAMSATPIPRTLNMSLAGIRDISVIETPPKDRLAIQTAVVPFKDEFIKEAIEFEIARGGQVFFVHNRVESIYAMKEYLERLSPGLRVIVGHGQMDEQELEKSMMKFIAKEYDVLLATTIIENGIDIPACNTMLINHAERFGLSQLYQLRGRVGRSDRLAFCYLLVPSERVLSNDARKRLAAIQEFSDLGAGFRIAAKDLEIRGAGNLLGGEQSGHIAAVGFEMYSKLLEEAVRELKGERVEEEVETSMNLGIDIYIPRDYIADESLRMMFYKRIASARDDKRLGEIRAEMRDRFGAIPPAVESLFDFLRLKLLAQSLGVVSIVRDKSTIAIKFHANARINPNKLLELVSSNPAAKFSPGGVLSLPLRSSGRDIVAEVESLLSNVALAA